MSTDDFWSNSSSNTSLGHNYQSIAFQVPDRAARRLLFGDGYDYLLDIPGAVRFYREPNSAEFYQRLSPDSMTNIPSKTPLLTWHTGCFKAIPNTTEFLTASRL
jgi:hypothetical protein